ncbi:MAG: serine/threonine protein kinase [Pseudomonadota bacterium]|nr:serine/threonine protein kinase [Pseudomonadota bacterium]
MAYTDAAQNPPAASAPPGGPGVQLGLRTEIHPSMALPDGNAIGGPAFAARVRGEAADCFAILCNKGYPPRMDTLTSMRTIDHPAVLRLVDSGVLLWPMDGMHYFAIAYQRPSAPRFKHSIDEPHPPMSEDAINHYFVAPLIGALAEFLRTGTVHNAINTSNIFWRLGGGGAPQLGDCLSAPAGLGQPILFETIERAMTSPMGRGTGTHGDDCYAFGVSLALLVLGHNPLRGLDERAVIQAKIERGSFAALIGNNRLTSTHSELLRGLLTDDARQRWSGAELEQWLSGRRLTPKNTDAGRRSSRHFEFAGKEYWQIRPLAEALSSHPAEAVRMIESGTLDKWLRRAMGDEERADDLHEAQTSLKEGGKPAQYESQLVSRACIALDPTAPIRYRGVTAMPAGIPNVLVDALTSAGQVQVISEIVSNQLVTFWVNMQKEKKTDLVPLGQQFERMRGIIERTSLGNGPERVAYELNTGLPCLSPMLRGHYVLSPKALLPALERVAGQANRPHDPVDRHIAAFLIVREKRSETLFDAIAAPETSPRKGLAFLTLFSEMQQRYGPDSLPALAQWLLPFLEVSVRRYLSKSLRNKVQQQIRETAKRGNLGALRQLVDDTGQVERDRQEFMAARLLYLNILKEITIIEASLAHRDNVIESEGKPIAANISGLLAVIFVMLAALRAVWQNM